MAEQANVFQDGVDRFRDAFGSLEGEIERVQKDFQKEWKARRKSFEKQLNTGRKDFEKRSKKLRNELQKNPTLKRLETFRRDATRQLEEGVENMLGALQIASKGDLQRVDRKLNQLNRKLKDIERGRQAKRANGQSTGTAA